MAWPTSTTVTAEGIITAAGRNALRADVLALNGYVFKSADESVTSSATLQNDNHLLLAIGGAGSFTFDTYLIVSSAANAAGDIQVGFTFPAGTLYWHAVGIDETLASGSAGQLRAKSDTDTSSPTATVMPYGASTSEVLLHIHGLLVATGSGTLQLMWAQNASNASATTVKAGSHMTMAQRA